MEQPVVCFELVGRNGASLEGFVSYSEVFGCDADRRAANDTFVQLQDELPDDVALYVSVRAFPGRSRAQLGGGGGMSSRR